MNDKTKLICLVLITLAILVSAGFYCWSVAEEQAYFDKQEQSFQSPSDWLKSR